MMKHLLAYLLVEGERRELYIMDDLSTKGRQQVEETAQCMEASGFIFE